MYRRCVRVVFVCGLFRWCVVGAEKVEREGEAKRKLVAKLVGTLSGAALAALLTSQHRLSPDLRQVCEARLGELMAAEGIGRAWAGDDDEAEPVELAFPPGVRSGLRAYGGISDAAWSLLRAEAIAAYADGMSVRAISFCLGVNRRRVAQWVSDGADGSALSEE